MDESETEHLVINDMPFDDSYYRQYVKYQGLKTIFMTISPYTAILSIALALILILNQSTIGCTIWLSMQLFVFLMNFVAGAYMASGDFPSRGHKVVIVFNAIFVSIHTTLGIILLAIGQIPYDKNDFLCRISLVLLAYMILRIILASCAVYSNPMSMLAWNLRSEYQRRKNANWDYETRQLDEHNDISDESCCICYESYEAGNLITTLKCGHYFHYKCIKEWLPVNNTCPFCRVIVEQKNTV